MTPDFDNLAAQHKVLHWSEFYYAVDFPDVEKNSYSISFCKPIVSALVEFRAWWNKVPSSSASFLTLSSTKSRQINPSWYPSSWHMGSLRVYPVVTTLGRMFEWLNLLFQSKFDHLPRSMRMKGSSSISAAYSSSLQWSVHSPTNAGWVHTST